MEDVLSECKLRGLPAKREVMELARESEAGGVCVGVVKGPAESNVLARSIDGAGDVCVRSPVGWDRRNGELCEPGNAMVDVDPDDETEVEG